jgi:hypothetical protein
MMIRGAFDVSQRVLLADDKSRLMFLLGLSLCFVQSEQKNGCYVAIVVLH